jgi:RimK family alpha-L-glutamate ligase
VSKKVWIFYYGDQKDSYECVKLVDAYARNGIDAEVLKPKLFDIIVNRNNVRSIRYNGEKVKLPNLVLSRTGSGSNYFTLALMRQLEKLNIPVVNPTRSVELVKDKLLTSQLLAEANLPTPKTMLVNFPINVDVVEEEIGFPCVVKLVSSSHGKGVYLCNDRKFFTDLMELIDNLKTRKSLIIQEFIDHKAGSDLRVWVINGQAVAAMKRTGAEGDFRANISSGGTGEIYKITPDVEELACKTAVLFGLDIAGIDLLFDRRGFKVCEANSSPGFEGIDQYCGKDMAQHIVDYTKTRFV